MNDEQQAAMAFNLLRELEGETLEDGIRVATLLLAILIQRGDAPADSDDLLVDRLGKVIKIALKSMRLGELSS